MKFKNNIKLHQNLFDSWAWLFQVHKIPLVRKKSRKKNVINITLWIIGEIGEKFSLHFLTN